MEKYRIPPEYRKAYNNLFKYDLPGAWRLIYTLTGNTIKILAIILEWCDHDEYQKKYSGKKRR